MDETRVIGGGVEEAMAIKVVTTIPIPAKNAGVMRIGEKKYPWDDMNVVGASFEFPAEISLKAARSIASKRQRVDNRTYFVGQNFDKSQASYGELRCWVMALELPPGMEP
jgi:hypothetical protein